jgi:Lamin Tail Domain/PKD domain
MHTCMRNFFCTLTLLCFALPSFAHATIVINEIMYDPPGTDTGNEWIELYNSGSSPVDLTGWTFNDGSSLTKHVFNVPPKNGGVGSIIIQPDGYLLVADNATNIAIEYPSAVNIIDSTMSMPDPNTGVSVTVTLFDNQKNSEDTATYVGGTSADNKGDSVQLINGSWVAASPTPYESNDGISDSDNSSNTSSTPSDDSSDTSTTTTDATNSSQSGGPAVYLPIPTLHIVTSGNRTISANADTAFTAVVYDSKGNKRDDALVTWSFGDGMRKTGASVLHEYYDSGEYVAVVHAATPDGGDASSEVVVTVKDASIKIASVSSRGITLANSDSRTLDLSLWRLSMGGQEFKIPEDTEILAGHTILFPSQVIELPIAGSASLLYPSGEVAATYPVTVAASETNATLQPSAPAASYGKVQAVDPVTSTKTNIQENEEAVAAPAATTKLAAAGAALPATSSTPASSNNSRVSGLFHSPWTFGLLGVMTAAGGAFILL